MNRNMNSLSKADVLYEIRRRDKYQSYKEVRLDQQKLIYDELMAGSKVAVRGFSKYGKTKMIQALGKKLENKLLLIQKGYFTEDNMGDIIPYVKNFIKKKYNEVVEIKKEPFKFLDEYIGNKGEKVLLCIDDFLDLNSTLRSELAKEISSLKNICTTVVWHHHSEYEEETKELLKDFKEVYLRSFTNEEIGLIARNPLESAGIDFSDEAVEYLIDLFGGRPWETMLACHEAIKYIENISYLQYFGKLPMDVNIEGLRTEHQDVYHPNIGTMEEYEEIKGIMDENGNYFYQTIKVISKTLIKKACAVIDPTIVLPVEHGILRYYSVLWNRDISDEERKFLKDISMGKQPSGDATPLINVCLVKETKNGYKINGTVFEEFVKNALEESQYIIPY